ncbi:hypothetical protein C5O19_19800 [Siphonobacter curvatus]|uniref:Uncharacterized protein n=2 Tax=Siphonobacter curvatus TaxID=2094562 RepID=A0A2S7IIH7_9BACT|nr:hypothetical protein C5O19_19800 [Siphonobacter curvatus]
MMLLDIYLCQINWWRPSEKVMNLTEVASASIGLGISFLLIQINAYISKTIYQPTIEKLPSTNLLLISNPKLGKLIKKQLHQRIFEDFGIRLLSEKQEANDPIEARKTIASAVARIRDKMRSEPFVCRRLTSYGFVRNLAGGSIVAATILIFIVIYQFKTNGGHLKISVAFFMMYLLSALLAPFMIRHSGQEYAETLIEQYLATPPVNSKTA